MILFSRKDRITSLIKCHIFGWDDLAVAGIAGGASLIGGSMSNAANAEEAKKIRDWEDTNYWRGLASQDRMRAEDKAYNTEMSNTAVQRRMEDMRRAGINPALAAGDAATAPMVSTGSAPGGGSGPLPHMEDKISKAVANAREAADYARRAKETEASTKTMKTQSTKNEAEAHAAIQSAELSAAHKELIDLQRGAVEAESNARENRAKITGSPEFIYTDIISDKLMEGLRTGASIYGAKKFGDMVNDKGSKYGKFDLKTGEILSPKK